MSTKKTLLLPPKEKYGDMPYDERKEAEEILVKKMKEDAGNCEDIFGYPLFWLFDSSDENKGYQPWQYKVFFQWLFKMMLIPNNAIALNEKFEGKGAQYLQNLLDFFDWIESKREEEVWVFHDYFDIENFITGKSTERFYSLWKSHVNPEQP